jgi:hypothetical protein
MSVNDGARPRRRAFDLTRDMLFRPRDKAEAIPLDQLERMVREAGPISGYAPWAPESKSATRVWATIGVDGLILYDHKTKIAHHWASRDPVDLAALVKALKRLGGA